MKTIKHKKLQVQRSTEYILSVTVPEWELPILQAIHRMGVQDVGYVVKQVEDDEVPTAEKEYERLQARYGNQLNKDGSQGDPYVQGVYGQFNVGIMNLQRAIDAAILPAKVA